MTIEQFKNNVYEFLRELNKNPEYIVVDYQFGKGSGDEVITITYGEYKIEHKSQDRVEIEFMSNNDECGIHTLNLFLFDDHIRIRFDGEGYKSSGAGFDAVKMFESLIKYAKDYTPDNCNLIAMLEETV